MVEWPSVKPNWKLLKKFFIEKKNCTEDCGLLCSIFYLSYIKWSRSITSYYVLNPNLNICTTFASFKLVGYTSSKNAWISSSISTK